MLPRNWLILGSALLSLNFLLEHLSAPDGLSTRLEPSVPVSPRLNWAWGNVMS